MKLYGLIGYPLGHSFSKKFFSEKFEREAIDAQYELFELRSIGEFPILRDNVALDGLNVTIPYKEQIIPFLDEMDETARAIGAVNVIRFTRDTGRLVLKGYNSDVVGFTKSITPFLQSHHRKALVLGTGGASKAIDYGLKQMGVETKFVSRTSSENNLTYKELTEKIMQEYTVIVNTSPVGMYPDVDSCPDIPYECLTEKHLLFDAVYNPAETLFLRRGKEQGASVVNGEQMLVEQALAAWEIWNE